MMHHQCQILAANLEDGRASAIKPSQQRNNWKHSVLPCCMSWSGDMCAQGNHFSWATAPNPLNSGADCAPIEQMSIGQKYLCRQISCDMIVVFGGVHIVSMFLQTILSIPAQNTTHDLRLKAYSILQCFLHRESTALVLCTWILVALACARITTHKRGPSEQKLVMWRSRFTDM